MIEVTAYQCEHCKKRNKTTLRKTKKSIMSHELKCLWNPARKSCVLCKKRYVWINIEMDQEDRCRTGHDIAKKIKVDCKDHDYCENHDVSEDLRAAISEIQSDCKHKETATVHNSIYDGGDVSFFCINCGAEAVGNGEYRYSQNEFAFEALLSRNSEVVNG